MFFDSIIFDLDNTLYDYDYCHEKALDFVIKKISKSENISYQHCKSVYTKCNKSLKYELNNTASSHSKFISFKLTLELIESSLDVVELDNDYWNIFLESIKPFDDVVNTFDFLSSKNIPIYILTDYTIEHQYKKVNKLGIRSYIKNLISSEEVGIEKPSSKSFQYALSKVSGKSTLFVGDNFVKDIKGSSDCGIFPFHFVKDNNFKIEEGYITFGDYSQFINFLREFDSSTSELFSLSKYFGQRFDLIQAAGGNISVKFDDILLIKSSGINLSELTESSGYSIIDNKRLLSDISNNIYNSITSYNLFTDSRASMETYMHSFLKKYTVHLHPIQLINILVRHNYKEILETLFPESLILPYLTPGIDLSKSIFDKYSSQDLILLANHGIILTTDNFSEVIDYIESLMRICEDYIKVDFSRYKLVNKISSLTGDCCYLSEDKIILDYLLNKKFDDGSYFPDKIIFCGSEFLFVKNDLENEIIDFQQTKDLPKVIIYKNQVYIVAKSIGKCRDVESVLKCHLLSIDNNSENNQISTHQSNLLNNLESEKYRKSL